MNATTIGGVTLDMEMLWLEEIQNPRAVGSAVATLGGGIVEQVRVLPGAVGDRITLQGARDYGWQKVSTVAALKALADAASGAVAVVMQGVTRYCRFRSEVQGGPVQFTRASGAPSLSSALLSSSAWCVGTIYLEVTGS